jgi:chemotaxis protein methyltransferase CheR
VSFVIFHNTVRHGRALGSTFPFIFNYLQGATATVRSHLLLSLQQTPRARDRRECRLPLCLARVARCQIVTLTTDLFCFDHSIAGATRSLIAGWHISAVAVRTMESLDKVGEARSLAQAIVEAVREPLLVLDEDFQILAASASFHKSFRITPSQTFHRPFFTMEDGAWDIPALRELLGRLLAEKEPIEGFALTHEFPRIGLRHFLLHARKVKYEERNRITILMGFEDITDRRAIEADKEQLQAQSDQLLKKEHMLLEEMQHRIVNSLQIIASILMLKARTVTSDETREHLQDAHRRVMSVAEVQRYLHGKVGQDKVELSPYLTKLCSSLASSMIGEASNTQLRVECQPGMIISADAISIGLIVTELVINALKYAFPEKKDTALVTVSYEIDDRGWTLSVSDNGVGKVENGLAPAKGGLGTSLVAALAHQLDAKVKIESNQDGTRVAIVHSAFASTPTTAAAIPRLVGV